MKGLLKKMTSWWSGLTTARRSAYVVVAVSALIAVILLVQWAGRVKYVPLYAGLEAKEANAVVEKLKEQNIPYRLEEQGQTILVPEEKVYDLRLQMAGSGLTVSGGAGFELFNDSRLGVTDFERRIDYQRALQEELRRTIVQMQEVEQARVHLVLPEGSLFIENEQPASAAVMLQLKPLSQIKPEQIKSIIFLVAGSVENLPPENVKVLDTEGRVLSQLVAVDQDEVFGTQEHLDRLKLKRDFEQDVEKRVQQMLEKILGPGKTVAMVTADLDFNKREVTRIRYGDEGVVRSEEVIEDERSSSGGMALAPVGEGNLEEPPVYPVGEEGESQSNSNKSTRNYEIDEEQEHIICAPGSLRSLSTAVAIDEPLNEEETDQVREIVAAATGFQEGRDQISVIPMVFDRSFFEKEQEAMEAAAREEARQERLKRYTTWGAVALGAIIALIIILILVRRMKEDSEAFDEIAAVAEEDVSVEKIPPQLSPEEVKERSNQERVKELARQNPDNTAQLIRVWLNEE